MLTSLLFLSPYLMRDTEHFGKDILDSTWKMVMGCRLRKLHSSKKYGIIRREVGERLVSPLLAIFTSISFHFSIEILNTNGGNINVQKTGFLYYGCPDC
jgi:hypothetical protein